MTFNEFLANPYDQNSFLISVGFVLVGVMLVVTFVYGLVGEAIDKWPKFQLGLIIGSPLALIGLFCFAFNLAGSSYAIDDQNRTIAETNLKKKYDIDSVLWTESIADFDDVTGRYYIKIQDSDSNILKFRYKVNEETREPHLLNEEDSDTPVKSKDLLLNKTEK